MKLNRKHVRKLILQEMAGLDPSRMGSLSQVRYEKQDVDPEINQTDVFTIRLFSTSPGYFLNGKQLTGEKEEAIGMLIEDQMTGTIDRVLLARIAQGMGAEFIRDQNFQEPGMGQNELFKPIPIEKYIELVRNQ